MDAHHLTHERRTAACSICWREVEAISGPTAPGTSLSLPTEPLKGIR